MTVLVTGANGQLGQCIHNLNQDPNFLFTDREELDLSDNSKVRSYFEQHPNIKCVINCAAYTAVDKAETEIEKARSGNIESAKNLAHACNQLDIPLIHISTDFVFDGSHNQPISENIAPSPLSVYGQTKLESEQVVQQIHGKSIILRTSWLYSEYGHNFVKTVLKLGEEREVLNVIHDQYGSPTYAGDLALFILYILEQKKWKFGLYHFSSEGSSSWFDFAWNIMNIKNIACKVKPISTQEYPTPAKRPQFSIMDKTKLKLTFNYEITHWLHSLNHCLEKI